MATPTPRHSVTSSTEAKFNLNLNILGVGEGKCGFLCKRRVKEQSAVYEPEERAFRPSPRNSSAEDLQRTVEVVADLIRTRCENDDDKFNIVCRAIKFDPANDKAITIRSLVKLKGIFES